MRYCLSQNSVLKVFLTDRILKWRFFLIYKAQKPVKIPHGEQNFLGKTERDDGLETLKTNRSSFQRI